MAILVVTYALPVVFVAVSFVIALASTLYFRRVRTRASAAMLIGAGGRLVVEVVSTTESLVFYSWLRHPTGSGSLSAIGRLNTQHLWTSITLSVVNLAFSLLFAVSLLLVLRDAADMRADDSLGDEFPSGTQAPSQRHPPNKRIERTP